MPVAETTPTRTPTALDRRYHRWVNHHFGGPSKASSVDAQTRAAVTVWGKRRADKTWLMKPPSTDKLIRFYNATVGKRGLQCLKQVDIAGHNAGDFDIHAVPKPHRLDAPLTIPIRWDADAHGGEDDAVELIEWVSQVYCGGRCFVQASPGGASGYAVLQLDPLTMTEQNEKTGEWTTLTLRGDDGRLLYPGRAKINCMLDRIQQGAAKLAKEAGFKAKLELKGRYHLVARPTADYDNPTFVQALPWLLTHPTEYNRQHPRVVTNWGEAVKLPRICTAADMDRLEQAVIGEDTLRAIIKDADLRTIGTDQPLTWGNVVEPKDAMQRKIAAVCDDAGETAPAGPITYAASPDDATIKDPTRPYMERVAACSRLALRQAKGNFSEAMDRALQLGDEANDGPFTGPVHAARRRLVATSLRRALRTFDPNRAGGRKRKRDGVWFDPVTDAEAMEQRLRGLIPKHLLQAHRLTYRQVAQVNLIFQRSITSGQLTHVTDTGLTNLAKHPLVNFGMSERVIGRATALLKRVGQIALTHEHVPPRWENGRWVKGQCRRYALGPKAVLLEWIKPALNDVVMAAKPGPTGARASAGHKEQCPPMTNTGAGMWRHPSSNRVIGDTTPMLATLMVGAVGQGRAGEPANSPIFEGNMRFGP
jgi:hypothetical protein